MITTHPADAPGDAYARFRSASYFPSINGLRAICALMIVKEHVQWRLPLPRLFEMGFLGVDVFFVISGFLIVTLLLRERGAKGSIDLRGFYVRRTLRIFPIYYGVIFLIALVAAASYGHSTRTWDLYRWSIPVFLIYGQDLIPIKLGLMFHTWSLAMEEQFYLVWPAIEKYLKPRRIVPITLLLLGLNQAFSAGYFADAISAVYGSVMANERPVFLITFTPILLGALAAHAMHHPASGKRLAAALHGRWTPFVFLLIGMAICQFAPRLQSMPRLILHLSFCGLLLSLVITPRNVFSSLLNARPLAYLGKISYGLYLYHVFVLAVVEELATVEGWKIGPLLMFGLVSLISVGVAALSFRFIERPVMALRQRSAGRGGAGAGVQIETRSA